jgi:hypothetical protein
MKIDPDKCRDPDLLAAEVRRLQAVIASGAPTLTDEAREALSEMIADFDSIGDFNEERCHPTYAAKARKKAGTLRNLLAWLDNKQEDT